MWENHTAGFRAITRDVTGLYLELKAREMLALYWNARNSKHEAHVEEKAVNRTRSVSDLSENIGPAVVPAYHTHIDIWAFLVDGSLGEETLGVASPSSGCRNKARQVTVPTAGP